MKFKTTLSFFIFILVLNSSVNSQEYTLGTTFSTALCDNNLYVSGNGFSQGALGLGPLTNQTPDYTQLPSNFNSLISKVYTNDYTTFILLQNGDVWGYGNNSQGDIGNGNLTDQPSPVRTLGINGNGFLTDIIEIDTSDRGGASLAIDNQGRVIQWGRVFGFNGVGALPSFVINANTQSPLSDIVQITAGKFLSFALDSNGNVWGWGSSIGVGALGMGNSNASSIHAIQIPGLTNVTKVDTSSTPWGGSYTIALRSDGTVWSWGDNSLGTLGDGTTINRFSPVQVVGPNGTGVFQDAVDITSNYSHSFLVKNDGTLWSWGQNLNMVLGNQNVAQNAIQNRPIQVEGINGNGFLQNVVNITTASRTAIAKLDGFCDSVAWGYTGNMIAGQGFVAGNTQFPQNMLLQELSCCGPLGGGDSGTFSGFEASETVICPGDCITVEAIVASGYPTIDNWFILGGGATISNTSGLITEMCFDNPGSYSIWAQANGDSFPLMNLIEITVLDEDSRKCRYDSDDNDNNMNRFADINLTKDIKIYPNPSSSLFNINTNGITIDKYEIKDIYGKRIKTANLISNESFRIDLSNEAAGIFFLSIFTDSETKVFKLLKH